MAEPLEVHRRAAGADLDSRVAELLETVGLDPRMASSYPHELSGGQKQRVCIARAIALEPAVLVLDEPVSAVDVSVQAQVLNLLRDLRHRFGMSYLLISHDLAVVRQMCEQILVMYAGELVEVSDNDQLYASPRHPYTRLLLDSIPGRLKSSSRPPQRLTSDDAECPFFGRCSNPARDSRCENEHPTLIDGVSCHHPLM